MTPLRPELPPKGQEAIRTVAEGVKEAVGKTHDNLQKLQKTFEDMQLEKKPEIKEKMNRFKEAVVKYSPYDMDIMKSTLKDMGIKTPKGDLKDYLMSMADDPAKTDLMDRIQKEYQYQNEREKFFARMIQGASPEIQSLEGAVLIRAIEQAGYRKEYNDYIKSFQEKWGESNRLDASGKGWPTLAKIACRISFVDQLKNTAPQAFEAIYKFATQKPTKKEEPKDIPFTGGVARAEIKK